MIFFSSNVPEWYLGIVNVIISNCVLFRLLSVVRFTGTVTWLFSATTMTCLLYPDSPECGLYKNRNFFNFNKCQNTALFTTRRRGCGLFRTMNADSKHFKFRSNCGIIYSESCRPDSRFANKHPRNNNIWKEDEWNPKQKQFFILETKGTNEHKCTTLKRTTFFFSSQFCRRICLSFAHSHFAVAATKLKFYWMKPTTAAVRWFR